MNAIERRLRALEAASGRKGDNSFHGQVARLHARGLHVPRVVVDTGETIE